jgi:hypothetical protein
MAPVMVCVVDTGMPSAVARNSVIAPPVSAQKPPTGFSLVIFWPMVLTMRQPPNIVPRPIARSSETITQIGARVRAARVAAAISSIQMMPIVFCASLPPWPRL